MRKSLLLLLAMLAVAMGAQAGIRDEINAHPRLSANNYQAYPDSVLPQLTPAPAGYVPFYMNHYGRHGSRWLISPKQYDIPVADLEKAARAGKLSRRGHEVLDTLIMVRNASHLRLGELSDIGAEQHQRIAERMVKNFPEIFANGTPVDAKSTIIIRCILSMQNATGELKALRPGLKITTDASEHDMHYMNYSDSVVDKLRRQMLPFADSVMGRHLDPAHMYGVLFTDSKWAQKNIDGKVLMKNLFDVTGNMQSHHQFENVNFYDVFSRQDRYDLWAFNNARWYILSGETPLTRCRADYNQANLLRNIIASADSALRLPHPSATLRYGHESVLLPLACLMGINGADYRTTDLETLAQHWQCCKIFPMACNIQLVYYRKSGSNDVLVKVLLNEHEAKLPVATDCFPYYHWSDVRALFEQKLAQQPQP